MHLEHGELPKACIRWIKRDLSLDRVLLGKLTLTFSKLILLKEGAEHLQSQSAAAVTVADHMVIQFADALPI